MKPETACQYLENTKYILSAYMKRRMIKAYLTWIATITAKPKVHDICSCGIEPPAIPVTQPKHPMKTKMPVAMNSEANSVTRSTVVSLSWMMNFFTIKNINIKYIIIIIILELSQPTNKKVQVCISHCYKKTFTKY